MKEKRREGRKERREEGSEGGREGGKSEAYHIQSTENQRENHGGNQRGQNICYL